MAQVLGPHSLIPSHASCERCVWLPSLRQLHSLLLPHRLLSWHPVLPSARQLHLPGCGGQIPCALPLRTLAPWPSTSLPKVMRPNENHLTEAYEHYTLESSVEQRSPMNSTTKTSPSARRSLMRAEDEPITLKKKACRPVCRRPSVMMERGDPWLLHLTHKFRAFKKFRVTAQKVSK